MDELRKRYAEYKGIPVDSVPNILVIKGKHELDALIGQENERFEHNIGEGTIEDMIEFTRINGQLEGKIFMHHDGDDDSSYYGFIFKMDSADNELKEAVPYGEPRKFKFKGTRKEIAEKYKEFIKLKEAQRSEKIQEQFARPAYADGLDFYISENKESSENRYSICFNMSPKNKIGLHMRPIGQILDVANKYDKEVSLIKDGMESVANSIISMSALYTPKDDNVTVRITGTDENSWKAAVEIYRLNENKFGED